MIPTFRPLGTWPYPSTQDRRGWRTFTASWDQTLRELGRELDRLEASEAVIGIVADGSVIRRDGMLRSDVRPSHPGVELSFTARAQPNAPRLVYATDVCEDWRHNVRSIALGLEALRAVDRYGITRRGEQYAGFAALSAGAPDAARGKAIIDRHGGDVTKALFATHPDHGGNPRDFADVQAYRREARV